MAVHPPRCLLLMILVLVMATARDVEDWTKRFNLAHANLFDKRGQDIEDNTVDAGLVALRLAYRQLGLPAIVICSTVEGKYMDILGTYDRKEVARDPASNALQMWWKEPSTPAYYGSWPPSKNDLVFIPRLSAFGVEERRAEGTREDRARPASSTHYSLLVRRPGSKPGSPSSWCHYDSLSTIGHASMAKHVTAFLELEIGKKEYGDNRILFDLSEPPLLVQSISVPQQRSGENECGLHALSYALDMMRRRRVMTTKDFDPYMQRNWQSENLVKSFLSLILVALQRAARDGKALLPSTKADDIEDTIFTSVVAHDDAE